MDQDLLIVLPLYNDWPAAEQLLHRIAELRIGAAILIVNDGSTIARPEAWAILTSQIGCCLFVLHLKRNIGHQRAIATALVYAYQHLHYRSYLIMDSDGEDRPEDIERLLAVQTDSAVVFASRTRRSESFWFRISYSAYRVIHWIATGIPVRVGNFSLLPKSALESLVVSADLWNHYAAAVFRSNLPRLEVPCVRGMRYSGESKMKVLSLVAHGLSALSVFADVVSIRFLAVVLVAFVVGLTFVIAAGHATIATAVLIILLLQLMSLAIGFCFLVMNRRSEGVFLPLRDCPYFYGRFERL